jgi:hypothetical protein
MAMEARVSALHPSARPVASDQRASLVLNGRLPDGSGMDAWQHFLGSLLATACPPEIFAGHRSAMWTPGMLASCIASTSQLTSLSIGFSCPPQQGRGAHTTAAVQRALGGLRLLSSKTGGCDVAAVDETVGGAVALHVG